MENVFDILILGTGLTESITAAALAKAGFKVAHLDVNPYYGADEASLSLDELTQWAEHHSQPHIGDRFQGTKYTGVSWSKREDLPSHQYSISLSPTIIPAVGPSISSLVSSGVARYGGFRLLEHIGICDSSGTVKCVPGSKEDIFKNKNISLIDKRRLMRFLSFAAGEFEGKQELENNTTRPFCDFLQSVFFLNSEISNAITYGLAFCIFPSDPTLESLQRLRRYLRSAGRYGPSPFLVGHYGGAGEIAQGYCRVAAVHGGVYILRRPISTIERLRASKPSETPEADLPCRYSVSLDDFPEQLICDLIISAPHNLPTHLESAAKILPPAPSFNPGDRYLTVARCIAIIDSPLVFDLSAPPTTDASNEESPEGHTQQHLDTFVLVFPPGSVATGSSSTAVNVLVTGEDSMSAPRGKWIIYLCMPLLEPTTSPPESLLRPYLDATLTLHGRQAREPSTTTPLLTLFYLQNHRPLETDDQNSFPTSSSDTLITPKTIPLLSETLDSSTSNAELVFWEAVRHLSSQPKEPGDGGVKDVQSFWPPLEADVDADDD